MANPFALEDFIAAWQRALDPKQGSPVADDLRLILNAPAIIAGKSPVSALGVEARGDSVLIVNLEQPAPYFPQLLSHSAAYPIYSDASARSHDPATWVSNGAYVLAGWSPTYGGRAREESPLLEPLGGAHTARRICGGERRQCAVRALSSGGARHDGHRPGERGRRSFAASTRRNLSPRPYLATAYYGLNLTAGPCKTNLQLRQALSMAIDRTRLVQSLAFGQAPAFGFVPPGTWNYGSQSWAWKDLGDAERVAEAKRLYAAAGYSPRAPLHLRLLFNSNPAIKHTAIVVASMWRETLGDRNRAHR